MIIKFFFLVDELEGLDLLVIVSGYNLIIFIIGFWKYIFVDIYKYYKYI